MKRPRRWVFLIAGLLYLLPTCKGLKATSLIFSKTSTTTTTTTTTKAPENEVSTESNVQSNVSVVTRPPLTGIPQIDYIWDPNLPRELNGFNLTDYPFLSTTPPPEEILFKCAGLHDGFYASVTYKCQIYHHCIYGIRYDFLCANFTAFDQRTFICHFASEVDCDNSPKFFSRNDALYKATTTTSTAPPPTPAREPTPNRRRRPLRRRRPQYDYVYDDDDYEDSDVYEDEPRGRGRRKRPQSRRPKPEYDEYEDERFDRRPVDSDSRDVEDSERRTVKRPRVSSRRRPGSESRPYSSDDRRVSSYDSRRSSDDRQSDVDSRGPNTEQRRLKSADRLEPEERRTVFEDQPNQEDRKSSYDENRRPYERPNDRPRKPLQNSYEKRTMKPNSSTILTDRRNVESRRNSDDRRSSDDRRGLEDRRNSDDEKKEVDYEEEDIIDDRPRHRQSPDSAALDSFDIKPDDVVNDRQKVRSSIGSVYDRPRTLPKIRRPVPLSQRDKYNYKPTTSKSPPLASEEYYDEYEDEEIKYYPKQTNQKNRTNIDEISAPVLKRAQDDQTEVESEGRHLKYGNPQRRRPQILVSEASTENDQEFEDEPTSSRNTKSNQFSSLRSREDKKSSGSSSSPTRVEYEYYDDEVADTRQESPSITMTRHEAQAGAEHVKTRSREDIYEREPTSDTTERIISRKREDEQTSKETIRPIVRVVKRPFLPSRGGSPYLPRGLQPLGTKSQSQPTKSAELVSEDIVMSQAEPIHKTRGDTVDRYSKNVQDFEKKGPYTDENVASRVSYTKSPLSLGIVTEKTQPILRDNKHANINKRITQNASEQSDIVSHVFNDRDGRVTRPLADVSRQFLPTGSPRTTHEPNLVDKNPLKYDLAYENDYDLTLNDALNPTLPNLTPRNVPSGFVLPKSRDYIFSNFRNRYDAEPYLESSEQNNPVQISQQTNEDDISSKGNRNSNYRELLHND